MYISSYNYFRVFLITCINIAFASSLLLIYNNLKLNNWSKVLEIKIVCSNASMYFFYMFIAKSLKTSWVDDAVEKIVKYMLLF